MQYPKLWHKLPYFSDSALLFEPWAVEPWAVFLDSANQSEQGQYDIIAANPWKTIETRNEITVIKTKDQLLESRDDPFAIVKEHIGDFRKSDSFPFSGGALGYFSYDLARRIENIPIATIDAEQIPEMRIGIYDWAVVVDHQSKQTWLLSQGQDEKTLEIWEELIEVFSYPKENEVVENFKLTSQLGSNLEKSDYLKALEKIKFYLKEGDCYQVNLAQRFTATAEGNSWPAYKRLRQINAAPFSAFLQYSDLSVLSSSPERFLKVDNQYVETKPIKGTRPRAKEVAEDSLIREALQNSPKDRAENLMIVDLLRNDLGKNCRSGSVKVPKLFEIESYATVHHLVSTVTGELEENGNCIDLLRGSFPGGSITGAPKVRSMQIIEELEPHRRGVYCGSIGYIGFNGRMDLNIAIRTIVYSNNTIRFWAGGGIVNDSDPEAEYQETYDKAAAMIQLVSEFYSDGA